MKTNDYGGLTPRAQTQRVQNDVSDTVRGQAEVSTNYSSKHSHPIQATDQQIAKGARALGSGRGHTTPSYRTGYHFG